MKTEYVIYVVSSINSDPEEFLDNYGYSIDIKYPMVLRPLFLEGYEDKDTFSSLTAAEQYLDEKLVKEYGETYTIIKQYSYEKI